MTIVPGTMTIKKITQEIRAKLLTLAGVSDKDYTAVLMQGSGTFGVESVLTSVIGREDKLLIVSNGAYGERMGDIAEHASISRLIYKQAYDKVPDPEVIGMLLEENPDITHVSMVHSETTSGILNDITAVAGVVKKAGKTFIVDAMSSFGGVDIPVGKLGIDFLISSANKCIQGVPGFSFIIANREKLMESKGKARSLSLDLYDQWETMERTESGDSLHPPMWCWPLPGRWRKWKRKAALRPETAGIRIITVCLSEE